MPQCMDIYNEYFLVNHMKKITLKLLLLLVIFEFKITRSFSLALASTDFGLSFAKKGELLPYIIKVVIFI